MKNVIILLLLIVSVATKAQDTKTELPEEVKKALLIKDDGKPLEDTSFEEGDAVVKVYLLGYRPEMNILKIQFFASSPITGIQDEYSFPVSENGFAEGKVSLVHTVGVLFRTPFYNDYILLSPNQESSIYIDLQQLEMEKSKQYIENQYMYFTGANAEINNQINKPDVNKFYRSYRDSNQLMKDVLGMTKAQYKDYRMQKTAEAIARISELNLTHKAADYLRLSLQYDNIYHLMFADSDLERAYRRANNNESTGYVRSQSDEDYYLFLKDSPINNSISLYIEGLGNMVNSCRYIRGKNKIQFSLVSDNILQSIENTENLTEDDKNTIRFIRSEKPDNWTQERKQLSRNSLRKALDKIIATGKLTSERKKEAENIIAMIDDENTSMQALLEANARLSMDLIFTEKVFTLDEYSDLYYQDPSLKPDSVLTAKAELFRENYKDKIQVLQKEEEKKDRRDYLAKYVGSDHGILFDLINTQNISKKFEEYESLTNEDLVELSKLENPFFKKHLVKKNEILIAKIEEGKSKGTYKVHEISEDATGEAILQEIIKPFEGKVIFIDFWATWCGPCRSAMKQFEPTKKSFEGKDVVFIYVTNESSPINAWTNMIPNMAGEHIRLKGIQFDYLSEKYGIKGIPSYLILDKKGQQVYFNIGFEGANKLANILNDELAK
ncbi:MAG: TlpA family protein disulfide reductase [Dysgonomonas sp.]